jgi:hypothetical protein
MKKFLALVTILFIATITFGQTPEKMSYQAVLRDANNVLVINQQVGIQISILQGDTAVYAETQAPITNSNGLVSLEIGTGSVIQGTFIDIDWSSGEYYIKAEINPNGSSDYTIVGISQILSVPFALHSKTSENGISEEQSEAIKKNTYKYSKAQIDSIILSENSIKFDSLKNINQKFDSLISILNDKINEIESSTLTEIVKNYNIEVIGTYGQSLAVGGGATSDLNDFKNTLTFLGGSSIPQSNFSSQAEKDSFFGDTFKLLENNDSIESYPPATASLTTVLSLIESENKINIEDYDYQLFPLTGGRSGASILTINRGTAYYNNYLEAIIKAKEFANNQGKSIAVRVINWVQGESNYNTNKENYKFLLNELFSDFNNDIRAITGQSHDVIFITYQVSPWIGRVLGGVSMDNMDISEVHVEIADENLNVFNCGAMYQFKYTDSFHPADRAVIGLQQGVAFKRLIHDEENWKTFKPISHQIFTNNSKFFIHLKFDLPVEPLRFDISGDNWHNPRGKQKNFGFELLKDGDEKQISEPYLTLGHTIVLTTDENPIGMKIRYAVNGHAGGGNLCDSQNIKVRNKGIDYVIDNFAVAFSEYNID